MKLLEAIDKTKFRELVKRLHPDNKETGNEELMKKLNLIKDNEILFNKFYNELSKKKEEPKKEELKTDLPPRPKRFKTDEEWGKWLVFYEKIKFYRRKKQEKMRQNK